MQVELRPIASIRPYENNPRINDSAVDAVAASIREFGFRQPIVVDVDGPSVNCFCVTSTGVKFDELPLTKK